jgi:hypothetical protein
MFCKSCGNKIDNDSQFCSFCGTKQSEINKPILLNNETVIQREEKSIDSNPSLGQQTINKSTKIINRIINEPKYDPNYEMETGASVIGSVFFSISLMLIILKPFTFEDIDSYNQFRAITSIVALVIRIFITIWVVNIAKKQNRETFVWGLFSFLLPSVALIVIGQQKKLFLKFNIDNSLTNEENSIILTEKAEVYLNDNKYNECIRFSEKAIELDINNTKASEILLKARLQISVYEITNKHTQVVYREIKNNQILKIVSKNYETIGASVFINELIAPDGEYEYLKDNRKIKVKTGKIEQMLN